MAATRSFDNRCKFQQEYLPKIRVCDEQEKTRLTGYKPLSAGRNADASDQTGVSAVHLSDTKTTDVTHSREEKQTERDHSRTHLGLYYFTLVHYHQTYLGDLLIFFSSIIHSKRMTDKPCFMSAVLQPRLSENATVSTTKIFVF